MSVDLDMEALGRAARACSLAAASFEAEASSALAASRALGLGWRGSGYASFSSAAGSLAVPAALEAAAACRSFARSAEDALALAESLRSRAEGFGADLGGSGGGGGRRLCSDDACLGAIDADLRSAESASSALRSAFRRAASALRGVSARSAAADEDGLAAGLFRIESGLSAFRGSLSAYRGGLAELEAVSARAAAEASRAFSAAPAPGGPAGDAPGAWREVARLAAGELDPLTIGSGAYSIARAKAFGASTSMEVVLSASGLAIGAHEAAFGLAQTVTKLVDAKAYAWIKGTGKQLGFAGYVVSGVSASCASSSYYDDHPELPEDRRRSNQAAEWDLQFAKSVLGAFPPVENSIDDFLYSVDLETNMSKADYFYEWRYELFGKYGL